MKIKQLSAFCLFSMALAFPVFAEVARLEVTVTPSTVKVNEFADVTIKALDADGKVVTNYGQNNDGDIMMYLDEYGNKQEHPDFVLPWSGFYFFEPADQGMKIFSKWFTVLKPGTYTLKVTELFNTAIKGEAKVTVVWSGAWPAQSNVKVDSPLDGSTIATDALTIMGTTQLPNTPIAVYLDNGKVQEAISDENANFTIVVRGVSLWAHTLEVKALDLANTVVGTSGPIRFTYQPGATMSGDFFVRLEIQPGKQVNEGDLVTFLIYTKDTVTSASIALWQWAALPAQKVQNGLFQKQMTMSTVGVYPVHLNLVAEGATREYKNVDTLTVAGMTKRILTLTPTIAPDPTVIGLNRTFTGKVERFKITYGTNRTLLNLTAYATEPKATITRATAQTTVYAQVFPVDDIGVVNWEPSPVVTIAWTESGSNTCYPGEIVLKTKQVNGQYYLYWTPVPGAKSYVIYRRDTKPNAVQEMTKVGEVTETMFAYPFDPAAETDLYAWYAVEAICENDDKKIVDAIKRVKVWPVDTLLVFLLVAFLLLGLSRLGRTKI